MRARNPDDTFPGNATNNSGALTSAPTKTGPASSVPAAPAFQGANTYPSPGDPGIANQVGGAVSGAAGAGSPAPTGRDQSDDPIPGSVDYGTGGTGGDPNAPGYTNPNGAQQSQSVDDMVQQFVQNSLQGNMPHQDTSSQDATIAQQQQQLLGDQLYDQRAALGASGFGASGAAVGLEANARRKAAMDASNAMIGVQHQADEDYFNHGLAGAGLDLQEQNFALQQSKQDAANAALQALLGGTGDGSGGGAGGTTTTSPGAQSGSHGDGSAASVVNQLAGPTQSSTLASGGGSGTSVDDPKDVGKGSLPSGVMLEKTLSDGSQVWKGPDGVYYHTHG